MLSVVKEENKKKGVIDKGGFDTREFIIQKTIEVVNEKGMSDFRVERLSSVLGLSPGNITYHFSKKENLSKTLWDRFYVELNGLDGLITLLMDVKQAFLVVRSITNLMYKYRGVVIFRNSDIAMIQSDNTNEMSVFVTIRDMVQSIIFHLKNNGYISTLECDNMALSLAENSMVANMRFWMSKEYLITLCDNYSDIEERMSENSVIVLYSLYSCLNKKGRREFDDLCKKLL